MADITDQEISTTEAKATAYKDAAEKLKAAQAAQKAAEALESY